MNAQVVRNHDLRLPALPPRMRYVISERARKNVPPRVLTSVDDLPEEVLAPQEVPGGAVPAPVPELVLALVDGRLGPLGHGQQHAGVVPDQAALLAAQVDVQAGVHVQHARREGQQVVGLPRLGDPPATRTRIHGHGIMASWHLQTWLVA